MNQKVAVKIISACLRESFLLRKLLLKKKPVEEIWKVAQLLINCLQNNHKVLVCGNGGSAADSQHWTGEMIGRFRRRRKALPFLSLTTNTSVLTSIGNDESFADIFSRQVEGLGQPGDILICISTSGSSPNVMQAASQAKEKGLKVISLTGKKPNPLARVSDLCLSVPSRDTPRIQEIHILLVHILCDLVETALSGS